MNRQRQADHGRRDHWRGAAGAALLIWLAAASCGCNLGGGRPGGERVSAFDLARQLRSLEGILLLGPGQAAGWVHVGGGGFTIADGVATSHGGRGVLAYVARPFADFVLTLQFRQESSKADSGVYVRFPGLAGDADRANEGYQVEIGPVMNGSNQGLAAIDNFATPIDDVPVRPLGQWNDLAIACVGQQYAVRLNGKLVTTFTGDRAVSGYVGLQNHDPTSIVHFRNVRVVPLQAPADAP